MVIVSAVTFTGLDASQAGQIDPMDWLIQDVCVNAQNQPMPVDPGADNGAGCADAGLAERDLLPGEALPYDKYNQNLTMMVDSYPAINAQGTQILAINPKVNIATPGVTGAYDIHGVQDGWARGMSTNDPVNYQQNSFGANCSPAGVPWFPATNYEALDGTAMGQAGNGVYFEHSGQAWPGVCTGKNSGSATMWSYRSFTYGGVSGNKITSLPTIIAFTGVPSKANIAICSQLPPTSTQYQSQCSRYTKFLTEHVELQFFTSQYGFTRWESWKPAYVGLTPDTTDCSGPAVTNDLYGMPEFNGLQMVRTACSDYTSIVTSPTPYIAKQAQVGRLGAQDQVLPSWPVPDLNLLQNWHFNTVAGLGSDAAWKTVGGATLTLGQSKSICDTTLCGQYSANKTVYAGPRYATLQCTGGSCSSYAALYQDVPISSSPLITNGLYTIGAKISAFNSNNTGQVSLSLSEIASDGVTVLSSASVVVNPRSSCVSNAAYTWCQNSSMTSPSTSVVKSARYYAGSVPLTIDPRASYLRFSIQPQTSDPYNIVDTWLMKIGNTDINSSAQVTSR